MTAPHDIDPARFLAAQLADPGSDLLRAMSTAFVNALMSAEAGALCGAEYASSSPERVNSRNGYRRREFDTRTGTLEVAIPKLRTGSYFPDWLLERRRRAEAALTSVVATCYLLGVSTRRMEKLVESLGITRLSKSQVSRMAADLDEQVEAFRTRPLDQGPYTFVAADALTMKVREGGRVVIVHALVATGVNADGHREILGLQVTSAEDGAGWLTFFRDLTARGLTGVQLVTSDAHAGLVAAIGATLPGAAWQRCRTHWACHESSCCFPDPGSTICYARRRRGPRSARHQVRGDAAASERAAAAVGAGMRGPAAGARRGGRGGGGGRGQPDHGAARGGRTRLRRAAAAGRSVAASRRRTQTAHRARPCARLGSAGAGRAG